MVGSLGADLESAGSSIWRIGSHLGGPVVVLLFLGEGSVEVGPGEVLRSFISTAPGEEGGEAGAKD
jgi:hypothetical protein